MPRFIGVVLTSTTVAGIFAWSVSWFTDLDVAIGLSIFIALIPAALSLPRYVKIHDRLDNDRIELTRCLFGIRYDVSVIRRSEFDIRAMRFDDMVSLPLTQHEFRTRAAIAFAIPIPGLESLVVRAQTTPISAYRILAVERKSAGRTITLAKSLSEDVVNAIAEALSLPLAGEK